MIFKSKNLLANNKIPAVYGRKTDGAIILRCIFIVKHSKSSVTVVASLLAHLSKKPIRKSANGLIEVGSFGIYLDT